MNLKFFFINVNKTTKIKPSKSSCRIRRIASSDCGKTQISYSKLKVLVVI